MRKSANNRTVKCTAGEVDRFRVIEDFLPRPDDLVPREDIDKVTLSRRSLDFFKREAKRCRGEATPRHIKRVTST
jgi:hypothetical protein